MSDEKKITDTELHFYLDQKLHQEQYENIKKKLLEDKNAYKKMNDYKKINQTLHKIYDPIMDEKIPDNLFFAATKKNQKSKISLVAASILFFLTGSLFGWHIKSPLIDLVTVEAKTETEINLIQPAMFAHTIYSAEIAHPVEINAERHEYLNQWLSEHLKTTLSAPDLSESNYKLIGGRLLPSTQNRMAAQYMYENKHGNRITLYVRGGNWKSFQPISYQEKQDYATFYWIEKNIGYALTGDLNTLSYKEIAKKAYQQLIY